MTEPTAQDSEIRAGVIFLFIALAGSIIMTSLASFMR
jgi:hypothetical protein